MQICDPVGLLASLLLRLILFLNANFASINLNYSVLCIKYGDNITYVDNKRATKINVLFTNNCFSLILFSKLHNIPYLQKVTDINIC